MFGEELHVCFPVENFHIAREAAEAYLAAYKFIGVEVMVHNGDLSFSIKLIQ